MSQSNRSSFFAPFSFFHFQGCPCWQTQLWETALCDVTKVWVETLWIHRATPCCVLPAEGAKKTAVWAGSSSQDPFCVREAVNKRLNMLFPWGLLFLFFCFWGMQLSMAALLRCSRWKIKICNGQNMGPHSPWWFVSRKPSLEMMTGAQRVATEEKCNVTLQKSSASLQNGDEASEG